MIIKNTLSNHYWPSLPSPLGAAVGSLLFQMDRNQWIKKTDILERQMRQISVLFDHAKAHSPFYRELYRDHSEVSLDNFSTIPIVSREMLNANMLSWPSKVTPPSHGDIGLSITSGSTGTPLQSSCTRLTHLFHAALAARNHDWARRRTHEKAAFVHEASFERGEVVRKTPNWQESLSEVIATGPSIAINPSANPAEQIQALVDFCPIYVIGYPSSLEALAEICLAQKIDIDFIEQVGTFGETLSDRQRDLFQSAWRATTIDGYSAKETGPIALQCPDHNVYHVQSDAVFVEVLRKDDTQCETGEVGRVVITCLHNFASPLLRYEIGDYAEVGQSCLCGRKLPVLNRILGRKRNLLRYPDGSMRWPSFSQDRFAQLTASGIPEIRQFQVVQKSLERLQVMLKCDRPFTTEEAKRARHFICEELGGSWDIEFTFVDKIARAPGGKFEDFLSQVI